VLNERGVGKICNFKPVRLSETGRAVWHPLASVKETVAGMGELRFCWHWSFKPAPLLCIPLCVSWAFLVSSLFARRLLVDLLLNMLCQYVILKHLRATKRSWKIFHGGPGKTWIFSLVKKWQLCG